MPTAPVQYGRRDGVEINVMKFQAKLAMEELRRRGPRDIQEDPPDEQEFAIVCPKCKSRDVIFEGLAVSPGKKPPPDANYNWTCEVCGHLWEDEGIEEAV